MTINYQEEQMVITNLSEEEVPVVVDTLNEMEKVMCQPLSIEENEDDNEVLVYVGDFLEYVGLSRLFNRYCPIMG